MTSLYRVSVSRKESSKFREMVNKRENQEKATMKVHLKRIVFRLSVCVLTMQIHNSTLKQDIFIELSIQVCLTIPYVVAKF